VVLTNIVLGLPVYSKLLTDDLIKDALESLDWNAPNEWRKKSWAFDVCQKDSNIENERGGRD